MIRYEHWFHKNIKLGTAVCLMASLLTACGGDKIDGGTAAKTVVKELPAEISILTEFNTTEPPGDDNPVLKEFEKRTNTKLKITWVSPNSYVEKQNAVLASGEMPDLMKVSDLINPLMRQMVDQGAFWDLTPFLKDYPHLMEYPKEVWEKTTINGKHFIIPSVRPLEGGNTLPSIRKDWLDKLNLKMPETLNELYEVLKAFTLNDPDGDGKPNTLGYTMNEYNFVQNVLNESNGKWKLQDGKMINTELEPGTHDALIWLNRLYKEKLIPEDFAAMKGSQTEDMAKAGKAGLHIDTVEGIWRSTAELVKTNQKADFLPLSYLKGPSGNVAFQTSGFSGLFLIPKKVPEDKVKKILALLDYGATEEGFMLACYGFEGVHYKVQDGFKITTEQALKDSVAQSSFGKIFERYDKYLWAYRTGMPKELFERNKKIIDERLKVSIADPSIGLISETNQKLGADYSKKIADFKVKVIMGRETIDAWDNYVKLLKADANYMKIIQEYNKAYQDRVKASGK
ncbi:extracellular solute-binding protein [Paenibacillus radicis (ex Xue et al. 2023)]|uniref:Extracellular solute-binding protein n=1 Tax=Paenibacillus radicis (ex Xue et al. 2023) TaxID=2972489 RepID=A0ABT1YD12_9BACL|nr:extracellular solute-binding protein [Paenibacillus radicis (ex Xue et al. 2023)]MCR8630299.1 extracellular solute-binding protein [Paenibacillus radicis (ex Xue et al. 2023)]